MMILGYTDGNGSIPSLRELSAAMAAEDPWRGDCCAFIGGMHPFPAQVAVDMASLRRWRSASLRRWRSLVPMQGSAHPGDSSSAPLASKTLHLSCQGDGSMPRKAGD